MHVGGAIVLAVAVWFILFIVSGFNGYVLLCAPLFVSGLVLVACLIPARRPRTISECAIWSSLER